MQWKPIPSLVQVPPAWQGWDSQVSRARLWLQRGPLHPGSHTQRNLAGDSVRGGRWPGRHQEGKELEKGLTRQVHRGRRHDYRALGHSDGLEGGRMEARSQVGRGSGNHFPHLCRSLPRHMGWTHIR